ncbi:MAG: hypothetical protein VB064_14235 [Oscillospiraceae bacterium]|nr:hypothetical protein [Oscillospiraceae bacterium]
MAKALENRSIISIAYIVREVNRFLYSTCKDFPAGSSAKKPRFSAVMLRELIAVAVYDENPV